MVVRRKHLLTIRMEDPTTGLTYISLRRLLDCWTTGKTAGWTSVSQWACSWMEDRLTVIRQYWVINILYTSTSAHTVPQARQQRGTQLGLGQAELSIGAIHMLQHICSGRLAGWRPD